MDLGFTGVGFEIGECCFLWPRYLGGLFAHTVRATLSFIIPFTLDICHSWKETMVDEILDVCRLWK